MSSPLPDIRFPEQDVLPQPFRMIDEVFCEVVLRAMAEISAREEARKLQEAQQPRMVRCLRLLQLICAEL
jgi:hypothetical protein